MFEAFASVSAAASEGVREGLLRRLRHPVPEICPRS